MNPKEIHVYTLHNHRIEDEPVIYVANNTSRNVQRSKKRKRLKNSNQW